MSELNEIIVDENKEIQPTAIQSSIDKITMELMMNRTHYKKYLLKKDPIKYKENQEYILKIQKYENKFANSISNINNQSNSSHNNNNNNNNCNTIRASKVMSAEQKEHKNRQSRRDVVKMLCKYNFLSLF